MFISNIGLKLFNKYMGLWCEELYETYKTTLERAKILSSFILLISSSVSCQQQSSMATFHVLFVILWQGHIFKYLAYKYNQYKCFFNAFIYRLRRTPGGSKERMKYRARAHSAEYFLRGPSMHVWNTNLSAQGVSVTFESDVF